MPFFAALAEEFRARGHELEVSAREFAQTVELAVQAGFAPVVIGGHGGRELKGKAGNLFGRSLALRSWARSRPRFDLAVSHNSYSQIIAARALGVRSVTLMDYEHQPANHLAFRLASRVVVPRAFPEDALRRFGATARKVRRYDGFKEDVYLADWQPRAGAPEEMLESLGVDARQVLVVVRPPARDALYHRFDNELFDALLAHLIACDNTRVVLLPRTGAQREEFRARYEDGRILMPREALDGATLIAVADLVVSAGGTMNREAAALGVPAATVYAGEWAAVDEELVRQGRLTRIRTQADIRALLVAKKDAALLNARHAVGVRAQVAGLIVAA
ncbi:MAG: uncharacterized protein QOD28_2786 [Acidobacteriota bacterium]|nr:uncharacterized protein [Acidobacteriota bacterium]